MAKKNEEPRKTDQLPYMKMTKKEIDRHHAANGYSYIVTRKKSAEKSSK